MRHPVYFLIIFLFCHMQLDAQTTYNIYIKRKNPVTKGPFSSSYSLVNIRDTIHIGFSSIEDMGTVSYSYYIKKHRPNGTYKIYINDTLRLEGQFLDGLREGKWVYYLPDGGKTTDLIHRGKSYGQYLSVNKSGMPTHQILRDTLQEISISTYYRDDREIETNIFYLLGTRLGYETFDEHGRIKASQYANAKIPLTYGENKYKDGKLDGEIIRVYKIGRFEFTYDENEIVKWKFFNFEQQKYTSEYPTQ